MEELDSNGVLTQDELDAFKAQNLPLYPMNTLKAYVLKYTKLHW